MIKITMSNASYCFDFIQKTTNDEGFKSVKSELVAPMMLKKRAYKISLW